MYQVLKRFMRTDIAKVKKGNFCLLQNKIMKVQSLQQRSQARGGAHYKVELKDVKTGSKVYERVNSGQTLEIIELVKSNVNYLYHDDSKIHCIDADFQETQLDLDLVPPTSLSFLVPDTELEISKYEDSVLKVTLPDKVILKVEEIGVGAVQTAENKTTGTREAILENGVSISVPDFVKIGDRITVKVEDGSYYQRE